MPHSLLQLVLAQIKRQSMHLVVLKIVNSWFSDWLHWVDLLLLGERELHEMAIALQPLQDLVTKKRHGATVALQGRV